MNILSKKIAKLSLLIWSFILSHRENGSRHIQSVDSGTASKKLKDGEYSLILDVRTEEEHKGEWGHIKGSILMPLQDLKHRAGSLSRFKEKPILVYCGIGGRSLEAAGLLIQADFRRVENLRGGMFRWNEEGHPVEMG